jgi:hypothetical protein
MLLSSACGRKSADMGRPAPDKNYHYRNADLGFSLVLPPEFIYYQTQRTESQKREYVDIDLFVPTGDTEYPRTVPGYANPVKMRVFFTADWDEILESMDDGLEYQKLGEKGGRTYTVKFWRALPADWQGKWSDEMKQKIVNNIKIE